MFKHHLWPQPSVWNNLNWLPISHQIRLRSICAILRYYRQGRKCLLLDPPIQFGWQHLHQIRCRKDFTSVALCRLASIKRNFCFAATTWWNSLPLLVHDSTMNFINFTKAVRNFLYGQLLIDLLFILFYHSCNCVVLLCS